MQVDMQCLLEWYTILKIENNVLKGRYKNAYQWLLVVFWNLKQKVKKFIVYFYFQFSNNIFLQNQQTNKTFIDNSFI